MTAFVIADAGATKISWSLVSPGAPVRQARTPGLNALLASREDASANFKEAARLLGSAGMVRNVYYYGTGCSTPEACARIAACLREAWPEASAEVEGDMLLAARSLLGDRRGVACILGTGSNAVLSDGGEISRNGAGLGFILGDNGAGSEIGKRLIADYLKGIMPAELREKMHAQYGLTLEDALENIYRRPFPNRYLASFAPFASSHPHPYIDSLVTDEFRKFLTRDVMPLMDSPATEVCFTGSIAKAFEKQLRETASSLGLSNIGTIEADPMPGIIRYYTDKSL